MHNLGHTRSARRPDHLLQTPDTFIRAPLPGMKNSTAIVHAGPAIGASFTQYTAEMERGGELGPAYGQRFVYVLEGKLNVPANKHASHLGPQGFAFFPKAASHRVVAPIPSRIAVIEKRYVPLKDCKTPEVIISAENDVRATPLLDDHDVQVRCLLPDSASFDFAINTIAYQPGAALPIVEMHVMEHGLLMLEGGGIYRLGDCWYPVTAGDFIWMAPWCAQWFGAIGKTPAKYLLYKDWNRHPLAT